MQYNISATINDFVRFVEFNESEKQYCQQNKEYSAKRTLLS